MEKDSAGDPTAPHDEQASLSIAAISGVMLFHLLAGLVVFAGFSPVALGGLQYPPAR